MSEKLCLQWNDFKDNLIYSVGALKNDSNFTDVTLACEDNRLNQAHRAILSVSSHPKMNQAKYNHLQASLGEFLAICSAGGTATLTFTTTRGNTSSNMNVSHGHLGPPPPPHRPRNRGPAARERRRQRAACHQAAPPASTAPAVLAPPSPAPAAPAAAPSPAPVDHPVTFATMAAKPAAKPVAPKPAVTEPHKAHKCNQCNFSSQTEAGLKIHVGKSHKRLQPTPAPVATPAPAPRKIMAPTKTMYYQPRDTQPAHVPPSPPCGKCGSETTWSASRTNHNKSWLHEFRCQTCTTHNVRTQTTLTTPPT